MIFTEIFENMIFLNKNYFFGDFWIFENLEKFFFIFPARGQNALGLGTWGLAWHLLLILPFLSLSGTHGYGEGRDAQPASQPASTTKASRPSRSPEP